MSYIINKEKFDKNHKFYIYVHYTTDGVPFYVGKGKANRCLHKHSRSYWWDNVVSKYGYFIEIKEINLNEDESFQKEIYWIDYFGRKQLKEGTLINLTDGGEGVSGRIFTQQEKDERSKFFKDNLEYLQSIGDREKYFGKALLGSDNPNYGNRLGKNPISKKVVKLNLNGDYICEYQSLKEAEIKNNAKGVYQVCNGRRNQLKGFFYCYKSDYITGNYNISMGKNNKKKVLQIDIKTNMIIKEYNSTQETNNYGFFSNHVARAARGERKTYKGFKWEYK